MIEYRYLLTRRIQGISNKGSALFVMLNPSTADETEDDPTIRRCMDFASLWNVRELRVINLFAMRSTSPQTLAIMARDGIDIIGSRNPETFTTEGKGLAEDQNTKHPKVIAAWGHHFDEAIKTRVQQVVESMPFDWRCLGTTKDGHPRHPLYVRRGEPLVQWSPTV